jgi:hypothetical protein
VLDVGARRVAAPASVAVLLGLAWTPLGGSFGPLGLLRGPLGWGLAGLALAAALAPESLPAPPRLSGTARVGLAWCLFAAIGLYYASRLKVSGDEPHYLLMAQSLWREGDLDLRDNFERGDYREYVPDLPAPHYGAPRPDGRPFPAHSPGLPLLLAPFYAIAGRAGCIVLLALCAALLCEETRRLALLATGDERAALFAWAASVGPPTFAYSFHVYSEAPSALASAFALRVILSGGGSYASAAAALAASALPWLHVKMIPAGAVLGLIAALWLRGRPRRVFLLAVTAAAAAYLAYYQWVLGRPTPLALYGGVPGDLRSSGVRAAAGLLLDRSFGLLPTAPIWLLALAGLSLLRLRGAMGAILAVGLATLAPVLAWRMWWGGQCPPARFLVPLVPMLGTALALRVSLSERGLARWRWWLLAVTAALALFMVARPEAMLLLNRRDRPTRVWDALSPAGGPAAERYLPSLVYPRADEARVALLWAGALGVVLLLDAAARRSERADRVFRGPALPLALLLAIGAGTELWARRPSSTAAAARPTAPGLRPWALRASGPARELPRSWTPGGSSGRCERSPGCPP